VNATGNGTRSSRKPGELNLTGTTKSRNNYHCFEYIGITTKKKGKASFSPHSSYEISLSTAFPIVCIDLCEYE